MCQMRAILRHRGLYVTHDREPCESDKALKKPFGDLRGCEEPCIWGARVPQLWEELWGHMPDTPWTIWTHSVFAHAGCKQRHVRSWGVTPRRCGLLLPLLQQFVVLYLTRFPLNCIYLVGDVQFYNKTSAVINPTFLDTTRVCIVGFQ